MTTTTSLTVKTQEDHIGLRLDVFISKLPEVGSRTLSQKIIKGKLVQHKKTLQFLKTSYTIKEEDIFIVQIPTHRPEKTLVPWKGDLDIIFEDEDLAVVNKASGIAVHPSIGHTNNTLVNLLLHHCHSLSMGFNEERPGIVHRIDLQTSGLLVIAKNNKTHAFLADQFKNKTAHRKYWALVFGSLQPEQGSLISWLKRDPRDRKKFASITKNKKKEKAIVLSNSPLITPLVNRTTEKTKNDESKQTGAKQAITHYKTLKEHSCGVSLIQCQLQTGRTHQIRVHMSEKGHSILGDTLYGRSNRWRSIEDEGIKNLTKGLDRLGLCAYELGFIHPVTKKDLMFKVKIPDNLQNLMQKLNFTDIVN